MIDVFDKDDPNHFMLDFGEEKERLERQELGYDHYL